MAKIPTSIDPELSKKYQIDEKTNSFSHIASGELRRFDQIEIGDVKDPATIQPQFKRKLFFNEGNVSIRLIDDEPGEYEVTTDAEKIKLSKPTKDLSFYEIAPNKKDINVVDINGGVDYINRGQITPQSLVAEYELFEHDLPERALLTSSFLDREAILFYGAQAARSYYELADFPLPIYRFHTEAQGNPMYADSNLAWLTFHYPLYHNWTKIYLDEMIAAIIEVLTPFGLEIEVRDDGKLVYKNGDKFVKFCTMAHRNDKLFLYLNFGTDYNRSMDLYKAGVNRDSKDDPDVIAGTLWDAVPDMPKSVVDDIADVFISKLGINKISQGFNQNELDELTRLEALAEDDNWRLECERDDILAPIDEDGAFEFQIDFKEKPSKNYLEFSLETKGVKFLPQDKLSDEEKFEGARRPANIVGSLAVYMDGKVNSDIHGMDYRNGKIGHIPRPQLIDANGQKCWGSLSYDKTNNKLRVDIPQDFLDNAAYPVRHAAGLTFGYSSNPATSYSMQNKQLGSGFTSPPNGTALWIKGYVNRSANGTSYKHSMAIYKYDGATDLITNSVSEESQFTVSGGFVSLLFANATTALPVLDNTSINQMRVYIWCTSGSYATLNTYYDTGDTNQGHEHSSTYTGSWPSTLADGTLSTKKFGLYFEYVTDTSGVGMLLAAPTASANDSGVGSADWSTLSNAYTDDSNKASTGTLAGTNNNMYDYSVKLAIAGTISGSNYAVTGVNWATLNGESYGHYHYGGPSDLWGLTPSEADVENSGFGFGFAVDVDHTTYSHYAKFSGFSFAIPNGATIDGIVAGVRRDNDGTRSCAIYYAFMAIFYTESAGGSSYNETYTEVTTLTDTIIKTGTKVLTDVATIVDSFIRSAVRTLTDTATHVDTVIRTTARTLIDTATHVDVFDAVKATVKTLTETATHVDTFVRSIGRTLSDTVTNVDTFISQSVFYRTLTDTMTAVDSILRTIARTLIDVVTHVDTPTLSKVTAKELTDTTTLTDSIVRTMARTLTDVTTAIDTVVRAIGRSFTDTTTMADSMIKTVSRTLGEVVTHVDTKILTTATEWTKTLTETTIAVDSLLRGIFKVLTENISLRDRVIRYTQWFSRAAQNWYNRGANWYTKLTGSWRDPLED